MRAAILVIAALVTACGESEKTVSFKDSEGSKRNLDVSESGDTRTVKSDDGLLAAVGTKGGEKAQFPIYSPQYPGSKTVSTVEMNMGGVKRHMITQQSMGNPAAILAFYKSNAQQAGKSVQVIDSTGGTMISIGGTSIVNAPVTISLNAVSGGMTSITHSVAQ